MDLAIYLQSIICCAAEQAENTPPVLSKSDLQKQSASLGSGKASFP